VTDATPTPTDPSPPTWDDMRALVRSRGADLDDARPEPRGVVGAQHERWLAGHHYGPERPPIAEPPPAPKPPRRRVDARVPEQHRHRDHIPPTTAATTPATPTRRRAREVGPSPAAQHAAVGRLVDRLRAEGVTTARIGTDYRGRPEVAVDDADRDRASRIIARLVGRV
jgi:hypothetical protein